MPAMPIEYEALRVKSQQTLFEFLDVELKLGRTFTQSAILAYNDGHADHYEQAKRYASRAADSVRHFLPQVLDPKIRIEAGERLAGLDRLICTL
jgi:hypothetical protein